jgi:DNA repair photolyase
MRELKRKSMLYKTGVEYGDYTMNHAQGCSHGCKYPCYAFLMAKRFGKVKSYEEWVEPAIVSNTLELLEKEIPRLKAKIQSVQLCFTTDPFMYGYKEIEIMSLAAIQKLNEASIGCSVLTKGILPDELIKLPRINSYGVTLISLDENYRKKVEPGAAPYQERIDALKKLHNAGCNTWVSIEPYPTPNLVKQSILDILDAISFTDRIVFGRTNYSKEISIYKKHKDFYNEEAEKVIRFCDKHGISYHVKSGTITKPQTADGDPLNEASLKPCTVAV